MIDFRCSFLVVTSGNPSLRSNRIWCPKTDRVPVPVRSRFSTPRLRISSIRSRYCRIASPQTPGIGAFAPRDYLRRAAPRSFFVNLLCIYWGCRREPAMAINGRRNKPFGPGGGTRRLHQFGGRMTDDGRQMNKRVENGPPDLSAVVRLTSSAYGVEIGSTRA